MADSAKGKKTASRSRPPHERTEIVLADLRKGTEDSESVRHLQRALGKHVDKALKPKVTGNYDGLTQRAVRTWQNENGHEGGRGLRLDERQASQLFGDGFSFTGSN
jgi:peptidoglycan hydrolase-like protein with peptidoglycan-binding domain